MILILLASGRGKRLNKITRSRPKCLALVHKDQTILDHINKIFDLFTKVIVVTGYKSNLVIKSLGEFPNLKFVKNKNFLKSNMVTSMCLAKKYVNNEVVISYTDILYSKSLIRRIIKNKNDIIPLKRNWILLWKKRFGSYKNIRKDAENVVVKDGKILEIGTKIKNKLPRYQYMGILKFSEKKFKTICKIYSGFKDKNISMTKFLDFLIKEKKLTFNYLSTTSSWFEVDNQKDLSIARKNFFKTK